MTKKLPRLTAQELIKALKKLGFLESRTSGSHRIYKKESKRIVVPFHSGKIIHPKIVKDVLKVCDLSLDEFIDLV